MEDLTITLSGDSAQFIRERSEAEGLSADAYLARLVAETRAHAARERLRPLLIEALESGPPVPVTPETWDEIRREVQARRDARRKAQ